MAMNSGEKQITREPAEEAIILTFDEIRVLLSSLGFSSCEGIYMPDREFSEKEVILTLHALSTRGLITVQENDSAHREPMAEGAALSSLPDKDPGTDQNVRFRMRPDVRRMIRTIGNPAGAFVYRPGENLPGFAQELYHGKEFYCYVVPDYVVVTERDWTRHDSIRVRAMDTESFSLWRGECEQEAMEQGLLSGGDEGQDLTSGFVQDRESEDAAGFQGGIRESDENGVETLSAVLLQ